VLRGHRLFAVLLMAGLILRVLSQIAYRPALLYIDSIKYLYGASPGADPVGYQAPLKLLLLFGNLTTVVAVQHVLGLAMAVALYVLLLRRGSPRLLAALAAAPVLLDAYQVQMEQTIMPDTWFEALIVTSLMLLLWLPRPAPWMITAGGLVLGASATVRQVGEILLVPALLYTLLGARSWRRRISQTAMLSIAFAAPILAYSTLSYYFTGHFWLSRSGVATMYGRMAMSADSATLELPAGERPLCPTPWQRELGSDGLLHDPLSPIRHYHADLTSAEFSRLLADFNRRVLEQEPVTVLSGTMRDALKLFALTRDSLRGDTPISRWQFQTSYPTFQGVGLTRDHFIVLGPWSDPAHGVVVFTPLPASLGGKAIVVRQIAAILRFYQLHGGYAPGPLLALAALAAMVGTLGIASRNSPAEHERGLAGLLMLTSAAGLLLTADLFEFSWRYQLPALITLPPAGALGSAAILPIRRRRNLAAENGPHVGSN
jgi:hypothetical protein